MLEGCAIRPAADSDCLHASLVQAAAFLADLPLSKLPGVGPVAETRLAEAGLVTVRDAQARSKVALQQLLG